VQVTSTTVDGQGSVLVEGSASPGGVVTVNDVPVVVGADGRWSFRVRRTAGPTDVRIEARSADGQSRSSVSLSVG
jgi:2-polyprenyl-6-methoxyphenol hydroxylase-like FAD-dependent oxidoreductase